VVRAKDFSINLNLIKSTTCLYYGFHNLQVSRYIQLFCIGQISIHNLTGIASILNMIVPLVFNKPDDNQDGRDLDKSCPYCVTYELFDF